VSGKPATWSSDPLSATKLSCCKAVYRGRCFTCRVTVTNWGPSSALGVSVRLVANAKAPIGSIGTLDADYYYPYCAFTVSEGSMGRRTVAATARSRTADPKPRNNVASVLVKFTR
jgi:hypothetical protein